jgi:hypothetical protein
MRIAFGGVAAVVKHPLRRIEAGRATVALREADAMARTPPLLLYIICLAAFEAFLELFGRFYWGFGPIRLGLLALALLFVAALRRVAPGGALAGKPPPLVGGGWGRGVAGTAQAWPDPSPQPWSASQPKPTRGGGAFVRHVATLRLVELLLAAVLLATTLAAARTIYQAAEAANRTNRIRLDEGRTTWTAARLLWQGENPYAVGALVDDTSYLHRLPLRIAAGIGPELPADAVQPALDRYLAALDTPTRLALLPAPAADAPPAARREVALLGYKYGPVPLLATAALGRLAGPAAVPLTTGICCLGLYAVLALILYTAGAGLLGAGLGLAALMLDPLLGFYFMFWTATDVWPLLFGFLSVLLAMRGWKAAAGLALALAVSSKIMPAAIFLLLLPMLRSWRALIAFAAGCAVLLLPWLLLDARGFVANVALWGAMMAPDTDSWVFGAPPGLVLAARAVLLVPILVLGWRLARRREVLLGGAFAALNILVLAGGNAFHNNYVPWFATWTVLAVAEAFCLPEPLGRWIGQPGRRGEAA